MSCKYQRGFSLPVAIFILVIMALVAAAAVTIMEQSQQGISHDVMSTRAFYAAESGAQSVLAHLFTLDGSAANCQANYPAINFTATGLAGCTASTQCSGQVVGSKTYYTISSMGYCAMSGITATRQIEITATTP